MFDFFTNLPPNQIMFPFIFQVPVKSWFDDASDSELLDLIPLFEKLSKVDSVYTVLCNSSSQSQLQSSQQHQQLQQQHQQSPLTQVAQDVNNT